MFKTQRAFDVLLSQNTVDSRYLEVQGTFEMIRDIHWSIYKICSIMEK